METQDTGSTYSNSLSNRTDRLTHNIKTGGNQRRQKAGGTVLSMRSTDGAKTVDCWGGRKQHTSPAIHLQVNEPWDKRPAFKVVRRTDVRRYLLRIDHRDNVLALDQYRLVLVHRLTVKNASVDYRL